MEVFTITSAGGLKTYSRCERPVLDVTQHYSLRQTSTAMNSTVPLVIDLSSHFLLRCYHFKIVNRESFMMLNT